MLCLCLLFQDTLVSYMRTAVTVLCMLYDCIARFILVSTTLSNDRGGKSAAAKPRGSKHYITGATAYKLLATGSVAGQ